MFGDPCACQHDDLNPVQAVAQDPRAEGDIGLCRPCHLHALVCLRGDKSNVDNKSYLITALGSHHRPVILLAQTHRIHYGRKTAYFTRRVSVMVTFP